MKYLSICSGIEAASVAWHPLGWTPVGFSEIEPFTSAVLAHHYPDVPNLGDMTKFEEWNFGPSSFDVLVGGTPCQAFSVAGLREGLNDHRGNLTLTFCELANHFNPEFVVWENVPGVLSDKTGAFGCLLAGLAGEVEALIPPGGRWKNAGYVSGPKRTVAWRVLDAQHFGVAQRRRRVFVVASAGDVCASEVLFERESLRRDSAPSRETREDATRGAAQCFEPRSPDGHARLIGDFSPTLNRMGGGQREPCVITKTFDFQSSGSYGEAPVDATLSARDFKSAKDLVTQPITQYGDIAGSLTARHDSSPCADRGANVLAQSMAVRRLTPVECERLQGFPDNYTNIPWRKSPESPDGPRYKALGNSMAVPCMRWIGSRIELCVRQEVA